jgi:hypothetical protein
MSDLSGITGMTGDPAPMNDQAAADTNFAVHKDHMVGAHPRTESRLGQGAEVRLVANEQRHSASELLGQQLPECRIGPAKVGSRGDQIVALADKSGHSYADSHEPTAANRRAGEPETTRKQDDVVHSLCQRHPILGSNEADGSNHGAIESHDCHSDPIDSDNDSKNGNL